MKPIEKVIELLGNELIIGGSTHENAPPGYDCEKECGVDIEDIIAASHPFAKPMRSSGKKHKKCMDCWEEYINQLAKKIDAFYKSLKEAER